MYFQWRVRGGDTAAAAAAAAGDTSDPKTLLWLEDRLCDGDQGEN